VVVPFPEVAAALAAHRVAAAFAPEPFVSQAEESGDTPVLDTDQGPTASFPYRGLCRDTGLGREIPGNSGSVRKGR
jgi:NitT/TauT family transport system substrate-binding protein